MMSAIARHTGGFYEDCNPLKYNSRLLEKTIESTNYILFASYNVVSSLYTIAMSEEVTTSPIASISPENAVKQVDEAVVPSETDNKEQDEVEDNDNDEIQKLKSANAKDTEDKILEVATNNEKAVLEDGNDNNEIYGTSNNSEHSFTEELVENNETEHTLDKSENTEEESAANIKENNEADNVIDNKEFCETGYPEDKRSIENEKSETENNEKINEDDINSHKNSDNVDRPEKHKLDMAESIKQINSETIPAKTSKNIIEISPNDNYFPNRNDVVYIREIDSLSQRGSNLVHQNGFQNNTVNYSLRTNINEENTFPKFTNEGGTAYLGEKDVPVELESLEHLDSFFLHKDESKRRTVFELRLIDGPLVLSAIDTDPCCHCGCSTRSSNTRFLFDSYGPVLQMQEERNGCCSHKSAEICSPPYKYIGHVFNTSSWLQFNLTVTGRTEQPLYDIRTARLRNCCIGHNYKIINRRLGRHVGSIYRRRDHGYRTGYTVYFPVEVPVREKALLIAAVFFLDDVVGEGDRGGLGFMCF